MTDEEEVPVEEALAWYQEAAEELYPALTSLTAWIEGHGELVMVYMEDSQRRELRERLNEAQRVLRKWGTGWTRVA